MLFTTPEQFIVLAVLLVIGWLLGYASAPGAKKWKRRVREQSDSFTAYYGDVEDKLRAATRQAADLKARNDALAADRAAAERTIAELRSAAAATAAAAVPPVAAPPAPEAPRPALALVETPPAAAPVAEPAPQHTEAAVASDVPDTPVEEVAAEPPEGAPPPRAESLPVLAHAAAPAEDPAAPPAPAAAPVEAEAMPPAPIGPAEPEMPSKGWFASSARDDLTRIRGIDSVLDTRLFGLGVTRFEDIEKLSAEDEMALEQRLALPVGYVGREQWRTQAALLRAGKTEEHAGHFGTVEA